MEKVTTYSEAIDYINAIGQKGSILGLGPVTELLSRLNNPQEKLSIIHVAGTNGKGSICTFLEMMYREEGKRVGRYISPTIHEYLERFQINGEMMGEDDFARLLAKVDEGVCGMRKDGCGLPTAFEIETAIAFLYFAEEKVDIVILEVGMGGREDATNVIKHPICTVFANIGMDHMQFLGDTIEKIAYEKAGIIKEGCPAICYPGDERTIQILRSEFEKVNCIGKREGAVSEMESAGVKYISEDAIEGENCTLKYETADEKCVPADESADEKCIPAGESEDKKYILEDKAEDKKCILIDELAEEKYILTDELAEEKYILEAESEYEKNVLYDVGQERDGLEGRKAICGNERSETERACDFTVADTSKLHILSQTLEGSTFIYKGEEYSISLAGAYQIYNAITAIETKLMLDGHLVKGALTKARWEGRFEKICDKPLFIKDGAHNVQGVTALRDSLQKHFTNAQFIFIIGVLKDKEYEKMMEIMCPMAEACYLIKPENARGLDTDVLEGVVSRYCTDVTRCKSVDDAVDMATDKWHEMSDGLRGSNENSENSDVDHDEIEENGYSCRDVVIVAWGSLSYIGDVAVKK